MQQRLHFKSAMKARLNSAVSTVAYSAHLPCGTLQICAKLLLIWPNQFCRSDHDGCRLGAKMHDDFRFSHHCILDTFQQQLHEHPSVPIEISRCMVISDMGLSDVGVRP